MNSTLVSESQSFIELDSLIARAVKHLASLGYRHGTIGNLKFPIFLWRSMVNQPEKVRIFRW